MTAGAHRPIDHAISVLERPILAALMAVPEVGWCRSLRGVEQFTGIPREVCRALIRGLIDDGLAEYHKGLWSEDGEPAGAGYSITPKGARMLLPDATGLYYGWDHP